MLYKLTDHYEELRAKIRAFAEEEVKPIAFMLDKNNEFPHDMVKKLAEMGLMGIPYEKKYGGAGSDVLSYAIAVEELARVDGGARCYPVGPRISGFLPDYGVWNRRTKAEISGASG